MTSFEFEVFWKKERKQAAVFAEDLLLKEGDLHFINKWILSWLEICSKNEEGNQQHELFQSHYRFLEKFFPVRNEFSFKYLLGRLMKIYDIAWGGNVLPPIIDGDIVDLNRFIESALSSKPVYTPAEFTALLAYLQGTPVSWNSYVFDNIWLIEKHSKFFKTADGALREKALFHLLDLNADKGFHYNIKDFKKILKLIAPEDTAVIHHLLKYKVLNNQGCYQVINHILVDSGNEGYESFRNKIEVIFWLENSIGSSPKKAWLNKLESVENRLETEELVIIAHWIINHEIFEKDSGTVWADDVYKRFKKSAHWYLEGIR